MSDLDKFKEIVDYVLEIILGSKPKKEKDIGQYIGLKRPKRARNKSGRYKKDDKSTPDVNEAWVGGKAPKKRKKK
tara:strand:+ start:226 stop:450 length:225 start_codon:yes stop_codon:yes gene_type:complete